MWIELSLTSSHSCLFHSLHNHCALVIPYDDTEMRNIAPGNGLLPGCTSHYPMQYLLIISKVKKRNLGTILQKMAKPLTTEISLKIASLKLNY